MMKLNTTAKALLIGVVAVALVAVAYAAVGRSPAGVAQDTEIAAEVITASAGEDCANCPYAGTDKCPAAEAIAKKPYVDTDKCIGCSKCVRVAPEAFEIDKKTGKAEIKVGASKEAVARGAKVCPVDAVVQ